ncbi:MAG TPA: DNA repair exonuclease [Chloroflexota bacterium]|nr:DNA repair exonuclease [Chloroflexota bacterium]
MTRFRFVHAADIHLGYQQYNLDARANDFARAFLDVVEYAREEHVDFVLLAGDLFHRSSADAWMLKQATHGLHLLREVDIPIVAVEGNHDTQHTRKNLSWMEYLCDQDLLCLLNVQVAANNYSSLAPFDPQERRGSWIDLAGARIYGMKYYGAATPRLLENVRQDLVAGPAGYTIAMLHAGIEGQVPHLHGGLTLGQLEPLRSNVDYIALGHVHKRLAMDDWIFNPGSTETNSMEEAEWPHGFFDVRVDTESHPKHQVIAVGTPQLRPFHRISIAADGSESLDRFVESVEETIGGHGSIPEKAVIELQLGGIAGFKRQDLPIERLRSVVEGRFSPLTVRVRNNLVPPGLVTAPRGERLRRAEVERSVIEQLVHQRAEYRANVAAWTGLVLDVKNMAAGRDTPAHIADHVRESLCKMSAAEPVDRNDVIPVEDEPLGGEPPCYAHLFEDW